MSVQGGHLSGDVPTSVSAAVLNAREFDYLRLKALGLTKNDIAAEWGVSTSTINHTLTRVHDKLDVRCAIDAFRVLGWLDVPSERGTE